MEGRRILWVAGGRDFDDRSFVRPALREATLEFSAIITGAARGADLTSEEVWREMQLPYIGIPARWNQKGKRAGYARNEEIAREGPSALLAFPGGRGTQHARDLAREHGIPIL